MTVLQQQLRIQALEQTLCRIKGQRNRIKAQYKLVLEKWPEEIRPRDVMQELDKLVRMADQLCVMAWTEVLRGDDARRGADDERSL